MSRSLTPALACGLWAVGLLWTATLAPLAHAEVGTAADSAPAKAEPSATATAASLAEQKQGSAVVNKLITAIRLNRDAIAAKQLGFADMTQALMGAEAWAALTPQQRTQASEWVSVLVRQTGFSRGREVYKYVDAVRFLPNEAKREGQRLLLPSTITVHRDMKKTEMAVTWVLSVQEGGWKIVDTLTAGESLWAGIHEDKVAGLLKKGGPPAVLATLKAEADKVGAPPPGKP